MPETMDFPSMNEIQRLLGEWGNAQFDCGDHDSSDDETYETVLQRAHERRERLVAAIQELQDAAEALTRIHDLVHAGEMPDYGNLPMIDLASRSYVTLATTIDVEYDAIRERRSTPTGRRAGDPA
jgi:hypothetical protein